MTQSPQDLRYTKEHEWVRVEGNKAYIGITDFAQSELGDIVFVELPEAGESISANATFGTVESVKTVSDLYSPVSGTVVNINQDLVDHPEKVNEDPYGAGWMIVVELSNPTDLDSLLDAGAYSALIEE